MKYSDGVDPNTVGEDDLEISNAKAGEDLFQNSKSVKYEVDSDTLFTGNQISSEQTKEDLLIFEEKMEFVNAKEEVTNMSSTNVSTALVLIICVAIIISYTYYFIQKRSVVKELKSCNENLNTI